MHGNRKTSEYAPDGHTSETIFAIPGFSPGIQQGVAISLWVKLGTTKSRADKVLFRDDLNAAKASDRRAQLLASLESKRFNSKYQQATPDKTNKFSFRPSNLAKKYLGWPKANDLAKVPPFNGPIERRQNSLIRFRSEKAGFVDLAAYLDLQKSDKEVQELYPAFMKSSGEFKAERARAGLIGRVCYNENHIVPYPFKPFDIRLAYLDDSIQPLFSRPSPQLLKHRFADNSFFITRDTADKDPEGPPFLLSKLVCDYDCLSGHTRHFPVMLKVSEEGPPQSVNSSTQHVLPGEEFTKTIANLSRDARDYLKRLGFPNPDCDSATASLIWLHALAIGYSPAYLDENADGIRQDWPRIPLPAKKASLLASAALGREIAALLDTGKPISGVTTGKIRPELKEVGGIARIDGRPLNPDAGRLTLRPGGGMEARAESLCPAKGCSIITETPMMSS